MTEEIRPDEAAAALAQIRDRQEQVIDVAMIPVWYWWLVGGLIVLLGAAVESGDGVYIGVGTGVFVLGLVSGTLWVVRRGLRVQVRNELLGVRGIGVILTFVAVTVGVSLGVGFGLEAAGVAYPATWGNATAALMLVVGGPLLNRALRRIMLDRRTGAAR
ncbi:MAG: hypothetical protein HOV79_28705 [Hamadaea sp.]|nr:hypothetical protein [Hamadaea sp.]